MDTKRMSILAAADLDDTITPREIGGKAWQLWQLRRLPLSVPEWCVVTTDMFNRAVEPLRAQIAEYCQDLRCDDVSGIRKAVTILQEILGGLSLTREDESALNLAVYRHFGITGRVAVRSSAVGEDTATHSFAGLYNSQLNVAPDRVPEAVIDVWRSCYSERSIAYRLRHGLSIDAISIAVIVQRMVDADRSGVMFTRDPDTLDREIVIEAAYGLGEGVVADRADTDSYRISWTAWRSAKTIRPKKSSVKISPNGDRSVCDVAVDPALQNRSVLSWSDIRELRSAGLQLEKFLGVPQDIEWCYDKKGSLHFLQSRPITPGRQNGSKTARRIWDNANIIESYPGLTLPLTFSFISANYATVFRNAACGLVWSKCRLAERNDIWDNMVGLVQGRVYYNLLNWYEMLSHLPGFQRHQKAWDQMIGIRHQMGVRPNRLPWYNRIYAIGAVARRLIWVKRTTRQFQSRFVPLYDRYRQLEFDRMSELELIQCFRNMERELMSFWHLTLYTDFCAMKYFDWLIRLSHHCTGQRDPDVHGDLLCGETGIESVAPVRSLLILASSVRNKLAYHNLFRNATDTQVWEKLSAESEYLPLYQQCLRHLDLYGDRCTEELKIETRTPREDPTQLIALIRAYLQSDLTVDHLVARERIKRQNAERRIFRQVYNPFTKLLLRFVLSRTRCAVAGRENMRFARTRAYGVSRALFRRFGDLLASRDAIAAPADIAYLTVPEIFGYVQGTTATNDLRALVQLRRDQYRQFAESRLPARFETDMPPALCSFDQDIAWTPDGTTLTGIGCSSGVVEGEAEVVRDPSAVLSRGRILVAESTDPAWVFLMMNSKGIVVERGSILSHTAIIGRELGIPTIVGAFRATRCIPDNARVRINGSTGEIVWRL